MTASQATGSNSGRRGRRRSAVIRPATGPTWTPPGGAAAAIAPAGRPGPLSLDDVEPPDRPLPAFAHASEGEMARILDFYRIRWEYEPHTFPILWNLEGMVVESFSPDFWLPDLELYLEMTTLRQKLVRKKNRKLRRIRELYPDIRVKLFYARDFRALLLKFGRFALADVLSGTSGQVVPVRDLAVIDLLDAGLVDDPIGALDPTPADDTSSVVDSTGAGPRLDDDHDDHDPDDHDGQPASPPGGDPSTIQPGGTA
jgi:hypoxanthine phosphoribosyltransferase